MNTKLLHIPLVALAVCLLAAAVAADATQADPTGTWQWTAKGRKGEHVLQYTLHLQLHDGKLTGTLSNPSGEKPISDSTFRDGVVAFSVAIGSENTVGYSGILSGDTITGTVLFPGLDGGNPVQREWTAKRGPQGPPAPSS